MALCTVLSACLGSLPDSLVRSKFVSCSTIVMEVIERQKGQVISAEMASHHYPEAWTLAELCVLPSFYIWLLHHAIEPEEKEILK